MPRKPLVRPYRWLAEYYDAIFGPHRLALGEFRKEVLAKILPRPVSACDLACGTGTTALALARQGARVFAVDLSPGMCRVAREKARRERVPIQVIRADMRTFRLPQPVDLITCEFDALNHIPQKEDLRDVLQAVARAIRPGGHFFFDVNNRSGFKSYWTGVQWLEQPGVAAAMRNGNDARHDRAWSDIEWFIQEGNLWRRHRERVEEVCWSAAEMRRTLREAGFDRVRAWDAAPLFKNALIQPGCRTIYLARKAAAG